VEHENSVDNERNGAHCVVAVRNKKGHKVGVGHGCEGFIDIVGVQLWWPYLSGPTDEEPGYLYTLETHLTTEAYPGEEDVYRISFGVRTVEATNTSFLVNGKPFYFRGFGRHEDYHVSLGLLLISVSGANTIFPHLLFPRKFHNKDTIEP
jgi:beta-galactosidase/beta-glucuronidase